MWLTLLQPVFHVELAEFEVLRSIFLGTPGMAPNLFTLHFFLSVFFFFCCSLRYGDFLVLNTGQCKPFRKLECGKKWSVCFLPFLSTVRNWWLLFLCAECFFLLWEGCSFVVSHSWIIWNSQWQYLFNEVLWHIFVLLVFPETTQSRCRFVIVVMTFL